MPQIHADAQTDLLIIVVVCPGRHFECVSQGNGAVGATAKKMTLSRKPGACVVLKEVVLNSGHGRKRGGVVSYESAEQ